MTQSYRRDQCKQIALGHGQCCACLIGRKERLNWVSWTWREPWLPETELASRTLCFLMPTTVSQPSWTIWRSVSQRIWYMWVRHQKQRLLCFLHCDSDHVFSTSLCSQTYIGTLLISVNPYKELDIYTKKQMDLYMGVNFFELPPHMYVFNLPSLPNQ